MPWRRASLLWWRRRFPPGTRGAAGEGDEEGVADPVGFEGRRCASAVVVVDLRCGRGWPWPGKKGRGGSGGRWGIRRWMRSAALPGPRVPAAVTSRLRRPPTGSGFERRRRQGRRSFGLAPPRARTADLEEDAASRRRSMLLLRVAPVPSCFVLRRPCHRAETNRWRSVLLVRWVWRRGSCAC